MKNKRFVDSLPGISIPSWKPAQLRCSWAKAHFPHRPTPVSLHRKTKGRGVSFRHKSQLGWNWGWCSSGEIVPVLGQHVPHSLHGPCLVGSQVCENLRLLWINLPGKRLPWGQPGGEDNERRAGSKCALPLLHHLRPWLLWVSLMFLGHWFSGGTEGMVSMFHKGWQARWESSSADSFRLGRGSDKDVILPIQPWEASPQVTV